MSFLIFALSWECSGKPCYGFPPLVAAHLLTHPCQLLIKAMLWASGVGVGCDACGGIHASGSGWVSLIHLLLASREASRAQLNNRNDQYISPQIFPPMQSLSSAQWHRCWMAAHVTHFIVSAPVKSRSSEYREFNWNAPGKTPPMSLFPFIFTTNWGSCDMRVNHYSFSITSKNLLSPSTPSHLHSYHLGPSYHNFSPGLLQQP